MPSDEQFAKIIDVTTDAPFEWRFLFDFLLNETVHLRTRVATLESAICYDGQHAPAQMVHILTAWETALRADDYSNVATWIAGVRAALEEASDG